MDARRHLPGRAPDPDADRGLGPRDARRPGADDRPHARTAARRSARTHEFDEVDLAAKATRGTRRSRSTRTSAWRRRARTTTRRILRRGYSFTDGMDERLGQLDAGPVLHRLPARPGRRSSRCSERLGRNDALNEYITHTGSALFAVPARRAAGRLRRRDALRVAARPGARLTRWASPPSIRSSRPARSPGRSPTRCRTTWAVERSSPSRSAGRASAASSSPPGSRHRRASRRRPSAPSSTSCRLRSSSWRCGSPGTTARRRLARSSSSRRAGAPGAASPERRLRGWSARRRPPS